MTTYQSLLMKVTSQWCPKCPLVFSLRQRPLSYKLLFG